MHFGVLGEHQYVLRTQGQRCAIGRRFQIQIDSLAMIAVPFPYRSFFVQAWTWSPQLKCPFRFHRISTFFRGFNFFNGNIRLAVVCHLCCLRLRPDISANLATLQYYCTLAFFLRGFDGFSWVVAARSESEDLELTLSSSESEVGFDLGLYVLSWLSLSESISISEC